MKVKVVQGTKSLQEHVPELREELHRKASS